MLRRCRIPDLTGEPAVPYRIKPLDGTHTNREPPPDERIVFGRPVRSPFFGMLFRTHSIHVSHHCRNCAMERIELIAPYTASANNSPITTFSHQRLRYFAPMKRALLVRRHKPPANNGNNTTWALLAINVSVMKSGMPGIVQISGETRHQTAIQRYNGC